MFGITMSHNSQSLKVENWSRKLSNLKAVNSESICCWEFWFCFRENVLRKIHTNSLTPTYTHNTLTHTQSPTCTRMYIHTLTQNQARIHPHSHTTQHVHKESSTHTHTHTESSTPPHTHIHRRSTNIAVEVPQSACGQEAFEIHAIVQKQLDKVSTVLNKCCEHGVIQLRLLKGDQD